MNQQATSVFKDTTNLTRWTIRFLYAGIAIAVIAFISDIFEYRLLSSIQKGNYDSEWQMMAAAESNDARQGIIGIIQLAVFIVTAILILKWIYRANLNARQLGATDMEFTPGWSIGWYFIPIAFLWKPYQAMKEIWWASKSPAKWKGKSTPYLPQWWWFFWIISHFLGQASFRLSLRAKELNELVYANVFTLLSDIWEIPLNLIILAIIARVYKMQMSHLGKNI